MELVLVFSSLDTYTVTCVKFYCISWAIEQSFSFGGTHQGHPWSLMKYRSVSEPYFGLSKSESAYIAVFLMVLQVISHVLA